MKKILIILILLIPVRLDAQREIEITEYLNSWVPGGRIEIMDFIPSKDSIEVIYRKSNFIMNPPPRPFIWKDVYKIINGEIKFIDRYIEVDKREEVTEKIIKIKKVWQKGKE